MRVLIGDFNNSFELNVDSTMGAECVRWSGSFDAPWHDVGGGAMIVDCGGVPYGSLEVDDDDNERGVHARNLVAHSHEGLINEIPRR